MQIQPMKVGQSLIQLPPLFNGAARSTGLVRSAEHHTGIAAEMAGFDVLLYALTTDLGPMPGNLPSGSIIAQALVDDIVAYELDCTSAVNGKGGSSNLPGQWPSANMLNGTERIAYVFKIAATFVRPTAGMQIFAIPSLRLFAMVP